jgi:hypothetical protein
MPQNMLAFGLSATGISGFTFKLFFQLVTMPSTLKQVEKII